MSAIFQVSLLNSDKLKLRTRIRNFRRFTYTFLLHSSKSCVIYRGEKSWADPWG